MVWLSTVGAIARSAARWAPSRVWLLRISSGRSALICSYAGLPMVPVSATEASREAGQ